MLPPPRHIILFELDSNVKFPLLRLLQFLGDLKSTILSRFLYHISKYSFLEIKTLSFIQKILIKSLQAFLLEIWICSWYFRNKIALHWNTHTYFWIRFIFVLWIHKVYFVVKKLVLNVLIKVSGIQMVLI
jgi:hypothetical protein